MMPVRSRMPFTSPPAQKAGSAPVRMTQRIAWSRAMRWQAASTASQSAKEEMALRRAGAFSVSRATWPSTAKWTKSLMRGVPSRRGR
jgi:hypothetical protein